MESPHIFKIPLPREKKVTRLFSSKKKKKKISKETDHKASDEGNKSRLCAPEFLPLLPNPRDSS